MSSEGLTALLAGEWSDPNAGTNVTGTNRLGRLILQRVGSDQLRLRLQETQGTWGLQFTEDAQRLPWRNLGVAAESSPKGPTWLIEIDPGKTRFFRATSTSIP